MRIVFTNRMRLHLKNVRNGGFPSLVNLYSPILASAIRGIAVGVNIMLI